jgi:hypothetical protein
MIGYPPSLMVASANANGIPVTVLGMDGNGGWGMQLFATRISAYRNYTMHNVMDEDVVLFVDASDVLFLGGEMELLDKFERISHGGGPQILCNPEAFQGDAHAKNAAMERIGKSKQAQLNVAENPWFQLNAGAMIGRGQAMKKLLDRDFSPSFFAGIGIDQDWLQQVYIEQPGVISLDLEGAMLFAPSVLRGFDKAFEDRASYPNQADFVEYANGRVTFTASGQQPVAVHFPGTGHWVKAAEAGASCAYYEVFKARYPTITERLGLLGSHGPSLACSPKGTSRLLDESRSLLTRHHLLVAINVIVLLLLSLVYGRLCARQCIARCRRITIVSIPVVHGR